jgi:hypothetical protein
VRGCVPDHSDPGHDKGRLANPDAAKRGVARGLLRCARPSEVAFLFLARHSAGLTFHFSSFQCLPLDSGGKNSPCSVLTLPISGLIERAWFAVVDSPAQVARALEATPHTWWFNPSVISVRKLARSPLRR